MEHREKNGDPLAELRVKVGVYLERSKGKGFHVLVFSSDWVVAAEARLIAKTALELAGLPPKTEVFPKQDRLTPETPWGSYLNLPYCGGDNPDGKRMVLDPVTLAPVPLQSFLNEVQTFPVVELPEVMARLLGGQSPESATTSRTDTFAEAASSVHCTGARRPTLVSVVGHLRCRRVAEDIAVNLLVPWAREHFDPPLPDAEVEKHIRGVYRRYGVPASAPLTHRRAILPTLEVGGP